MLLSCCEFFFKKINLKDIAVALIIGISSYRGHRTSLSMLKTEDDGCFRNEIIRRQSLPLTFAHWNLWRPLPFCTAFNLGRPLQRVTLITGEVAG